jgi:hypothetical protein
MVNKIYFLHNRSQAIHATNAIFPANNHATNAFIPDQISERHTLKDVDLAH